MPSDSWTCGPLSQAERRRVSTKPDCGSAGVGRSSPQTNKRVHKTFTVRPSPTERPQQDSIQPPRKGLCFPPSPALDLSFFCFFFLKMFWKGKKERRVGVLSQQIDVICSLSQELFALAVNVRGSCVCVCARDLPFRIPFFQLNGSQKALTFVSAVISLFYNSVFCKKHDSIH